MYFRIVTPISVFFIGICMFLFNISTNGNYNYFIYFLFTSSTQFFNFVDCIFHTRLNISYVNYYSLLHLLLIFSIICLKDCWFIQKLFVIFNYNGFYYAQFSSWLWLLFVRVLVHLMMAFVFSCQLMFMCFFIWWNQWNISKLTLGTWFSHHTFDKFISHKLCWKQ